MISHWNLGDIILNSMLKIDARVTVILNHLGEIFINDQRRVLWRHKTQCYKHFDGVDSSCLIYHSKDDLKEAIYLIKEENILFKKVFFFKIHMLLKKSWKLLKTSLDNEKSWNATNNHAVEFINQIWSVLIYSTKHRYWACIARICFVMLILHIKRLDFAFSF